MNSNGNFIQIYWVMQTETRSLLQNKNSIDDIRLSSQDDYSSDLLSLGKVVDRMQA